MEINIEHEQNNQNNKYAIIEVTDGLLVPLYISLNDIHYTLVHLAPHRLPASPGRHYAFGLPHNVMEIVGKHLPDSDLNHFRQVSYSTYNAMENNSTLRMRHRLLRT